MKQTDLEKLAKLATGPYLGYRQIEKDEFKRLTKKLARFIADELGLTDASIRYNAGGIAVSGETVLHSEHLYVCLMQSCAGGDTFYYRSCAGKTDYTGGPNQHFAWKSITDAQKLIGQLKAFHARTTAVLA